MQTFATPAPVPVVLDVPAGHLRFAASDRTDTTVEIQPADPSRSRDVKAAERTTAEHRDGTLHITAEPTKNRLLGNSGFVRVTVHLPTGSPLRATTASADLRTTGRLGEVTYDSAHGTVSLDHTGDARLSLLAGDITVTRLDGSADISTRKGDIHVAEAVQGTVTLHTEAGNLTIGAAPTASATLDAATTHGRITNSLKNTGTPDLTIHATTTAGDITARSL
ncbi:DUF4097 family beta strand repeat-containing protein [Streptomyces sp. NPDC001781]